MADNNKILFKKGTYDSFKTNVLDKQSVTPGALYLTENEGGLYIGTSSTEVKRIQGSVVILDNLETFANTVKPPYSTDVIYFISDEDALVRWKADSSKANGGDWVVLNATATNVANSIKLLQDQLDALNVTVTDQGTTLAKALLTDGTRPMAADLAMGSHKITGLAAPNANTDAATKKYVDDAKTSVLGTAADASTANTVYGAKKAASEASQAAAGALKAAEDAQDTADAALPKSGGTMTGAITMSGTNAYITGLANLTDESQPSRAVNKKYVDDIKTALSSGISGANSAAAEAKRIAEQGVVDAKAAQDAADAAQGKADDAYELAETANQAAEAAKQSANNRVLTTTFDAFKVTNTQAINDAAALGQQGIDDAQAAKEIAEGAVGDAEQAQEKADQAYNLADTANQGLSGKANTSHADSTGANGKATASLFGHVKLTDSTSTDSGASTGIAASAKAVKAAMDEAKGALAEAEKKIDAAGGTLTGTLTVGTNGKITGLAAPAADTDAANKKYVDDAQAAAQSYTDSKIAANDAMTFKGVVQATSDLPTTANKGDTYKVGAAFNMTIGGKSTPVKIGDLLINIGADNSAPTWTHVSSGYEDDYLQKILIDDASGTIYLNDGVNETYNASTHYGALKFEASEGTNLSFTVNESSGLITVTASMEWGSFTS